jgi:hypothetical protein
MLNEQTATNPMSIHNAIRTIDTSFEPDPAGMIDAIGTTADGRAVDLWIYNDGNGPLLFPGASFLPYGGVYYNPLLVSVKEA